MTSIKSKLKDTLSSIKAKHKYLNFNIVIYPYLEKLFLVIMLFLILIRDIAEEGIKSNLTIAGCVLLILTGTAWLALRILDTFHINVNDSDFGCLQDGIRLFFVSVLMIIFPVFLASILMNISSESEKYIKLLLTLMEPLPFLMKAAIVFIAFKVLLLIVVLINKKK